MKLASIWVFAAVGCGGGSGGGGGEPQLGDAALQVTGGSTEMLATASAVQSLKHPGMMQVQLGTDHVDCTTDLDKTEPPAGTYVYFTTDPTMLASNAETGVTVFSIGAGLNFSGGAGPLTLTENGPRVQGTIEFMGTLGSDEVMLTGSFDILKCF